MAPRRRRPACDLAAVRAAAASPIQLRITKRASEDARRLGYSTHEMCELVQGLTLAEFRKIEMSHDIPGERMDVYIVRSEGLPLYIKVARDASGFYKLVSVHEA